MGNLPEPDSTSCAALEAPNVSFTNCDFIGGNPAVTIGGGLSLQGWGLGFEKGHANSDTRGT